MINSCVRNGLLLFLGALLLLYPTQQQNCPDTLKQNAEGVPIVPEGWQLSKDSVLQPVSTVSQPGLVGLGFVEGNSLFNAYEMVCGYYTQTSGGIPGRIPLLIQRTIWLFFQNQKGLPEEGYTSRQTTLACSDIKNEAQGCGCIWVGDSCDKRAGKHCCSVANWWLAS